jgi:hypothetical protein
MEFANSLSIDFRDWKAIRMRREMNSYTYYPATNLDRTAASTSLGVILPKPVQKVNMVVNKKKHSDENVIQLMK